MLRPNGVVQDGSQRSVSGLEILAIWAGMKDQAKCCRCAVHRLRECLQSTWPKRSIHHSRGSEKVSINLTVGPGSQCKIQGDQPAMLELCRPVGPRNDCAMLQSCNSLNRRPEQGECSLPLSRVCCSADVVSSVQIKRMIAAQGPRSQWRNFRHLSWPPGAADGETMMPSVSTGQRRED